MKAIIVCIVLTFTTSKLIDIVFAATCGYDVCPVVNPDELNVHLIPHSHDDVGWLKTVNQYYLGRNNSIQRASIENIIDSVISSLGRNSNRRFIQVETAYFWQWWRTASDFDRQKFKAFVENGQIEMIGGGWSMNDEAAVNYQSVIDQFTLGLRVLNETVGECGRPKIGWQIDPFGHSKEMAAIFNQLGYDGLFLTRIDYRDKKERLDTKTGEFMWRGSDDLGDGSLLFTNLLYHEYSAPEGFCFDYSCSDDPIIDDEESPDYNLLTKIRDFVNFTEKQSTSYQTNNIILTMGEDFQYQEASIIFLNLDRLIQGFKDFPQTTSDGRRINVLYSSPSCYLKAVNDESKLKSMSFPVKTDDFFPYISNVHDPWTGYYVSRPQHKRYERQGNNILQILKQLTALSGKSTLDINLDELRRAMGVMQHHDAITGTEKQHVAQDYTRMMHKAVKKAETNLAPTISNLLQKNPSGNGSLIVEMGSCLLSNVSHCDFVRSQQFVVTVNNPLSYPVSQYVRLPTNSNNLVIVGPGDERILYELTPSIHNFTYVEGITQSKYDLHFLAKDVPPLGMKLYYFQVLQNNDSFVINPDTSENWNILGSGGLTATINQTSGLLSKITMNNITLDIDQRFMYYFGFKGNNSNTNFRSSGAYVFRPSEEFPEALPFLHSVDTVVYKNSLVDEAHQTINSFIKQIIRVYKEENHVEFDWLVGPIHTSDDKSREVISRFTTNLNSNDVFYTDANGKEIMKRIRNYRPTFTYTNEEPVSANYHPINSGITIEDEGAKLGFAVLTDRTQGGSSLTSGQVELMVHRRMVVDDRFGVNEALNEEEFGQGVVIRGQHYVLFGSTDPANENYLWRKRRLLAKRKQLSPWVFLGETNATLADFQNSFNFEFSGLASPLPEDLHVLTLESWREGEALLRLENIFQKKELGIDSSINLENLFKPFNISSYQEMTLGANQLLSENQKLTWNVGDCLPNLNCSLPGYYSQNKIGSSQEKELLYLKPMEIRTFIANTVYN